MQFTGGHVFSLPQVYILASFVHTQRAARVSHTQGKDAAQGQPWVQEGEKWREGWREERLQEQGGSRDKNIQALPSHKASRVYQEGPTSTLVQFPCALGFFFFFL